MDCGVLERELAEYVERLTHNRPRGTLGPKLGKLRETLGALPLTVSAAASFTATLDAIERLIDIWNAVLKNAWIADSTGGYSVTTRNSVRVRHAELPQVASNLRDTKKLLLHLMHDHLPVAAGRKRRPVTPATTLAVRLSISLGK